MTTSGEARPSGRGVTPVTAASRTMTTADRPGPRGPVLGHGETAARGMRRDPIGGTAPRASRAAVHRRVQGDRVDPGHRSPGSIGRVRATMMTGHAGRTTVRTGRPVLRTAAHDRRALHPSDRHGRSGARDVRDSRPPERAGSVGPARRPGPGLVRVARVEAPHDPGDHRRAVRPTVPRSRSPSLLASGRTRSSWLGGDPSRSRSRRADRRSGSSWCLTDATRWSSSCCMPRRCASRSWRSRAAP